MYNMSMLRHRFSNEWWGGGGAVLNHFLLLFCKSVYVIFLKKLIHINLLENLKVLSEKSGTIKFVLLFQKF